MATIHLIDGEKGGVGKSMFARTIVQYCLDKRCSFVPIETDTSNPDLSSRYKDICQYAIFSVDEKELYKADKVFEIAIDKTVIVDLPAQSHKAVSKWIEKNKLIENSKAYGVKICKWFVCSGGHGSVSSFIKSLDYYELKIQHILVRNWSMCDDWEDWDEDEELQRLIKKYKVAVIDFPKLAYKERNTIDKEKLSFYAAREYEEFGKLAKQRVVDFLKATYAEIESASSEFVK